MENQQYIQEDEINLRDFVNVVIKRKKLILSIFLVSIVAAVAASLLMPKVYEITSTVQLGSDNDEFIIKKEKAKEMILKKNFLLSIIKELNLKIGLNELRKNIKVDFKEFENLAGYTDLIKITITYPGLDMVSKIHDAIVNPLIAEGQSLYQKRLAITHEWLEQLDQDIKDAETSTDRIQTVIFSLSGPGKISQSKIALRTALRNTIIGYEESLIMFREQRNKLKLTLVGAKDFQIFDPPIKPKKPIRPNMELNVLIVGVISLVSGVFLAFFMESWQKSKD
jgi:LPS O-antigen subunit length determinant protein (WzzB/FepE family)